MTTAPRSPGARRRLRKAGMLAMHLGALVVLVGAVSTALFGRRGFLGLSEGETKQSFRSSSGIEEPLGFGVRLDNFMLREFQSSISIIEGGRVLPGRLEANRPFKYKGYLFYQSRYSPARPDWSGLEVVRDPGVGVVYSGFALLNLGAVLTAFFAFRDEAGNPEA